MRIALLVAEVGGAVVMKYRNADRPVSRDFKPYHISISPGVMPRYVLLPGSPERVVRIAEQWDEKEPLAEKREFLTYAGKFKGVPIASTSLGIGGASASIAIEELASIGVDTFVRVGSTGSIQERMHIGDLVINTASVRYDGTTINYMPPEYPAAAHYEVVQALVEAAETLGYRYHMGISCSTSSFYAGQSRTGFKGYAQPWITERIEVMRRAGVLNFEEEAAVLFVLSSLYGFRSGAISFVIADRVRNQFEYRGEDDAIRVANESIRILADWDGKKADAKKEHFFPALLRR